ncbi:hypothetical protein D3C87_1103430 [compost metagenome]
MNQAIDQREALHELRQQPSALQSGDAPDTWVLLWSQSQNSLHIERLYDMHRTNLEAFSENRRMDYVPMQIGSREDVDAAANAVRPICHARAAREA